MRAALVSVAVATTASPLAAQQADTLPFRAGQWGAEFTAANFSGVGLLRFSNPHRAWLVDVQGQVTRQSGGTNSLSSFDVVSDSEALQLRLGRRFYAPVAPRVVRHVGVGVLGRYASQDARPGAFAVTAPFSYDESRTDFSGGVFAEVGAQWMITANLGLGAAWSANLQAGRRQVERISAAGNAPPERTQSSVNTWGASFGGLAIRGAVFF